MDAIKSSIFRHRPATTPFRPATPTGIGWPRAVVQSFFQCLIHSGAIGESFARACFKCPARQGQEGIRTPALRLMTEINAAACENHGRGEAESCVRSWISFELCLSALPPDLAAKGHPFRDKMPAVRRLSLNNLSCSCNALAKSVWHLPEQWSKRWHESTIHRFAG
jgi:hypothetical protein